MAAEIIDPVCGSHLSPTLAPFEAVHEEKVYYFCSDRCRDTFKHDPATYANPEFAGEHGNDSRGEECLLNKPAAGCR